MTADPTDTPLSRRAEALRARMADHPSAQFGELDGVERERGWLAAIAHPSRHGGLTHAGEVEARRMVAASGEWYRERAADDDGPSGSGTARTSGQTACSIPASGRPPTKNAASRQIFFWQMVAQ